MEIYMKIKSTFVVMFTVLFLLMFIGTSFAATSVTATDFTNTGLTLYASDGTPVATSAAGTAGLTAIGKTSSGVTLICFTSANGYSVGTQHKNGTKAFGSSFDSTSLYSLDVTAGQINTTEFALTTIQSSEFDNWDEM